MTEERYEIDERIALVRRNILELTQRVVAVNGAAAEERLANLISDQQELLDDLLKEREETTHPIVE